MDLISGVDLTKYYRYDGSLSSPGCDEAVVWTVFREHIVLNASVVEGLYHDIYVNKTDGKKLLNNFRPTMARNGRAVWASAALNSTSNGTRVTTSEPDTSTRKATQPKTTATPYPPKPNTTSTYTPRTTTVRSGSSGLPLARLSLLLPLALFLLAR
eukprot:gi/632992400/ref/XP_007885075.1/ PREDICTED: uncharacterized protein LOC103174473 [Callorhinchus milii]